MSPQIKCTAYTENHIKSLKQKHLCWQSSAPNHRIQCFSHRRTLNQPTWLSLPPGVQSQGTPDKATDMRIWLNVVSSAPNQTCCSITSNAGSFDWKWDDWMTQWTTVLWNCPRQVWGTNKSARHHWHQSNQAAGCCFSQWCNKCCYLLQFICYDLRLNMRLSNNYSSSVAIEQYLLKGECFFSQLLIVFQPISS